MQRFIICLLMLWLGLWPSWAGAAKFYPLGGLTSGSHASEAQGVSADGAVVVGMGTSESGSEAFRWTEAGGMVGLGDLSGGAFESFATSISADGKVVVGFSHSTLGYEAFRWTASGGMVGLGELSGGLFDSEATDVSSNGAVVVGFSYSTSGNEAFRWTQAGGMVGMGNLTGGVYSQAFGVSADGAVVAGIANSVSGDEAFRWTEASGIVPLGDLSGGIFMSRAYGISADGAVVVGSSSSSSGIDAFRWTEAGGMVGLGDLSGGSFNSYALGVSGNGSVVVGQGESDSGVEAFIWDMESGIQNLRSVLITDYGLDLTGWTLYSAKAMSPNGRAICGKGLNPDGNPEAWLVLLDPLELNWQNSSSGDWDTPENWDFVHPATQMTDVLIQPNFGLTVTGPIAPATIKSLTIGAQNGIATLYVQDGGTLNVAELTTIDVGGRITGNGTFNSSGGILNLGEIDLGGYLQLTGSTLVNEGVINGGGRVAMTLQNNTNCEIRVGTGEKMRFFNYANINDGTIEVIGGQIEFVQSLTNTDLTGAIFARDALLRFRGSGLANFGSLGISFGTTDVFGTIINATSGKIVLSGNSNTTFYGDILNDSGLIKVSAGSTAVFFGDLGGSLPTGPGTILIEGDLQGGALSGSVELAGLLSGGDDQTHHVKVLNDSSTGLIVSGVNYFVGDIEGGGNTTVRAGASLTADSIRQNTLTIGAGARVVIRAMGAGSTASAVPEPSVLFLLAVAALGMLLGRQRRTYD
jgi:probable HAF family extracellular repeat protein